MKPDSLLRTAERIADGEQPDFATTRGGAASSHERELVDELAAVARIARECRRLGFEAALPDDTRKRIGESWGHLQLTEVVGQGSFGTVFRAWDPSLQRDVAVKLFRPTLDPARVLDEGRKLARVRHPNVVTVYGADVLEGIAGIWMEFVEGRRLDELVGDQGPLSAAEAAVIGLQVAAALSAVHAAGLVHRDVKAQNVMREQGGRIVLMDLGASLNAAPETAPDPDPDVIGTPFYMAPELFDQGTATRETDIYSLGVLLFYLVSGRFPLTARTLDELRTAHRARARRSLRDVRPGIDSGYVALVDRMLAASPSARYATAGDLERDLSPFAGRSAGPGWTAQVGRRWPVFVGVVVLVAAGAWVYRGITAPPPVPATPPRSVAVLPIQNDTGDPGQAYLAAALTQVLGADVARIRELRVPSAEATAPFRDRTMPMKTVAARLKVDLILLGSIQQSGDRLGLAVQLIDPAVDRVVWGENVWRPRGEIMGAQAEIARKVAAFLALQLSPAEERALAPRLIAPTAQDFYLRGLVARADASDAGVRLARDLFAQAVAADPSFAAAWGQLALTELYDVNNTSVAARDQALDRIRHAALRSVDLDPAEPAGYTALGTLQLDYDWDFAAAEASLRRAIDVSPSYSIARQRYAMLLAARRRLDEAIAQAEAARDLEPFVPNRLTSLGVLYYYKRDWARAADYMRQALAIQPDYPVAHFGLGRIAAAQQDFDRAVREIQTALGGSRRGGWLIELARVYTQAGRTAEARAVLDEIDVMKARGQFGPGVDSEVYIAAAAGRIDDAFQLLDRAIDARVTNLVWITVDPRADPLRGDPRFEGVLRRMGH